MRKVYLLILIIFIFQRPITSWGVKSDKAKAQDSIVNSDMVERIIYFENLPTLSDFESQFKKIKTPTDRIKLQYCDLIAHASGIDEIFKRNDLIEICKDIAEHADTTNLTDMEKSRAFVLGLLLSTSRKQEIYFAEKLETIDPDNAFVTAIKLKNSILYSNIERTEELIKQFMTQENLDLYIQPGYQNRYNIWTSFFGENLQAIHSLQMTTQQGLISRRIQEYTSLFYMYDANYKYQRSQFFEKGTPLIDYFSLDQLFLHKVKQSFKDFGWHANITDIQLDFFYRLYHDSTLYYASGITIPRQRYFSVNKSFLDQAKQYWLCKRDELQEIFFKQRKKTYELIKLRSLTVQKIESIESVSDSKYLEFLKLYTQGKESQFINHLSHYDAEQPDNMVNTHLLPLIEEEKQFWRIILTEKFKEENKVEKEISIDDMSFE